MSWEIIQTDEYSSWFLEQDEFTQLKVRQAKENARRTIEIEKSKKAEFERESRK